MKKLTFDKQIIIGLAVLLIAYIGSWIFKQGIFVNAAWVLYGLAFIIHPVYPEKSKDVKNIQLWVRLAGVLCVLVGIITRFGV
ncbi:MAG: oxidoreductase membrane subunit [Eubacteriales bacterium]|nr:oxidoreductase membrane subunit [Eubacteriales bacterium]